MTEPTSNEKMLNRVRGLLNKAFDPAATDEEKVSYENKANALIASHGIDMAKLKDPAQKDELVSRDFWIDGEYALDRRVLFYSIGLSFRCSNQLFNRRPGNRYKLRLHGFQSDIERTEFLYDILQLQALSEMRKAEMPYYVRNRVSFNKNWLSGFISAVCLRLNAAEKEAIVRREAEEGSTGTELVLADRKAQVQAYLTKQLDGKKLRTINRPKRGYDGREEGREAGKRASLNETQLGDRRARIGS